MSPYGDGSGANQDGVNGVFTGVAKRVDFADRTRGLSNGGAYRSRCGVGLLGPAENPGSSGVVAVGHPDFNRPDSGSNRYLIVESGIKLAIKPAHRSPRALD